MLHCTQRLQGIVQVATQRWEFGWFIYLYWNSDIKKHSASRKLIPDEQKSRKKTDI